MAQLPPRPRHQSDFRIAIICALSHEAGMVQSIFDKDWAEDGIHFVQAKGDQNAYTLGTIGKHNVVLAHMPGMGVTSAATVAAGLRSTYHKIEVAFVVGICGTAPIHPTTNEEIILGDCIISTTIKQYDFGRHYHGGLFMRKQSIEDVPGRSNFAIRAQMAKLQTEPSRKKLSSKLVQNLEILQEMIPEAKYPGPCEDRLYDKSYVHTHHDGSKECNQCISSVGICSQDCKALGCEEKYLIKRTRLSDQADRAKSTAHLPQLHFGIYGSANTVLRSGEYREWLTATERIVAFEMEGAGIWDSLPTILVKSACDYGDSHKTGHWQIYAAATAAAALKAILEFWKLTDIEYDSDNSSHDIGDSTLQENNVSERPDDKSFASISPQEDQLTNMTDSDLRKRLEVLRSCPSQNIELSQRIRLLRNDHSLLAQGLTYWSHLTVQGYRIYDEIYGLLCQPSTDAMFPQDIDILQFFTCLGDLSPEPSIVLQIWQRCGKGIRRPLRKCFMLAIWYMLHVEHYSGRFSLEIPNLNEKGVLSDDRLQIIRSFAEWACCSCSEGCNLKWNFGGEKWGIVQGPQDEFLMTCMLYKRYREREAQKMDKPGTITISKYSKQEQIEFKKARERSYRSWLKMGRFEPNALSF